MEKNSIQSSVAMGLSLGSVQGVFLEALVLYVQIWVCSESVVQSNGSNSKLGILGNSHYLRLMQNEMSC